jgi:hypothetical protein
MSAVATFAGHHRSSPAETRMPERPAALAVPMSLLLFVGCGLGLTMAAAMCGIDLGAALVALQ